MLPNELSTYTIIKSLGRGNHAEVKLARHKRTGHKVAVKIINKTFLQKKALDKLQREISIMQKLTHPHIVQLYEIIESNNTIYLVMEYAAGGELYDYLIVRGHMKEKEARDKFFQLLAAVRYCHHLRIIHRDIKPENILLDDQANLKIADWGFSNYFDPSSFLETACGSPAYASPEVFSGKQYTGPEVDLWSLGIVLYAMTTACVPFDGKSVRDIKAAVLQCDFAVPSHCSPELTSLLRKLINRDISLRDSVDKVLDDPWLNADGDARARLDEIWPLRNADSPPPALDDDVLADLNERFELEPEEVEQAVRNGAFDEISAMYHYLRIDKQRGTPVMPMASVVSDGSRQRMSVNLAVNLAVLPEHDVVRGPGSPRIPMRQNIPTAPASAPVTRRPRSNSAAAPMVRPSAPASPHSPTLHQAPTSFVETVLRRRTSVDPLSSSAETSTSGSAPGSPNLSGSNTPVAGIAASPMSSPAPARRGARNRPNSMIDAKPSGGRPQSLIYDQQSSSGSMLPEAIPEHSTLKIAVAPASPRVRFMFSSNTVSSKSSAAIAEQIATATSTLGCKLERAADNTYLLHATQCKLELEICRLPRLTKMYGLRFKRREGPSDVYKKTCESLLALMKL